MPGDEPSGLEGLNEEQLRAKYLRFKTKADEWKERMKSITLKDRQTISDLKQQVRDKTTELETSQSEAETLRKEKSQLTKDLDSAKRKAKQAATQAERSRQTTANTEELREQLVEEITQQCHVEAKTERAQLEASHRRELDELNASHKKVLGEVKEELAKALASNEGIKEDLKGREGEWKASLEKQLAEAEQKHKADLAQAKRKATAANQKSSNDLAERLQTYQEKLAQTQRELEQYKETALATFADHEEATNRMSADLVEARESLVRETEEKDQLAAQIDELMKGKEELAACVAEVEKAREELQGSLQAAEEEREALKEQLEARGSTGQASQPGSSTATPAAPPQPSAPVSTPSPGQGNPFGLTDPEPLRKPSPSSVGQAGSEAPPSAVLSLSTSTPGEGLSELGNRAQAPLPPSGPEAGLGRPKGAGGTGPGLGEFDFESFISFNPTADQSTEDEQYLYSEAQRARLVQEVNLLKERLDVAGSEIEDLQVSDARHLELEGMLKQEIRNLRMGLQEHPSENESIGYISNVVHQFMMSKEQEEVQSQLVPVLATVLQFTPEQVAQAKAAYPTR